MGDFFGIVLFFVFVIFLFMGISKVSGMSIGYRNKGAFVEPDDLDKVISKSRKLVDRKYKDFKELEEKYLTEYNKSDRAYKNLINASVWESIELEKSGLDKKEIETYLNQKYSTETQKYYRKCRELKEQFEKLTGRKLNVK